MFIMLNLFINITIFYPMLENISKSEFVNFLLEKKHNIEPKTLPILEQHIREQKLDDFFLDFSIDFTDEELNNFLSKLDYWLKNTKLNSSKADVIFGLLYSCNKFIKLIKNPTFSFVEIKQFYNDILNTNKNYIIEYNKKDKGKINIAVEGNVVTRFPPEPSGFLHIGHIKAALLNDLMAKNGKLLIRFDDTNPIKEEKMYENVIIEDLHTLGIKNYTIVRSSDHFDSLYNYAIQLIQLGLAYCDNTDQLQMREERTKGIPSKNRNTDIETNLSIFSKMSSGNCLDYCLRAKIDYTNLNKALRDPVIYRHIEKEHNITKNKYKIYPTYDFACPIIDSLDGVTLALRTNEYRDRNEQYYWFLEKLNLPNKPKIYDFSRLNFENTVLSKRQMKFYVDNHFVSGWDDPRLSTLRGILRLGMDIDTLKEYIINQGSSQKSSVISWDKVWSLNKKNIDHKSARYSAIPKLYCVECLILDKNNNEIITKTEDIPKFKKNLSLGNKTIIKSSHILISQEDANILNNNEEFTLMNWGNMKVKEKQIVNGIIIKIILEENLAGDVKTTKNKLTWVNKENIIEFKILEYDTLQNDKNTDNLAEKFNTNSKKEEIWLGEKALISVSPKTYIQIERIGFFICDKPLEFILIPYTKQKRMR